MKFQRVVDEYLIEMEVRNLSPTTVSQYAKKMKLFGRWLEEEGIVELEEVTLPVIKRYAHHMLKTGAKGSYVNAILKVVRNVINYAWENHYGGFNTKDGSWFYCKQQKTQIVTYAPRHIKMMFDNCKGNSYVDVRNRCLLTFYCETGCRAMEGLTLKNDAIKDNFIVVMGKGRKERIVPLTSVMRRAMFQYENARDKYFKKKGIPVSDNYFLSIKGDEISYNGLKYLIKSLGRDIEDSDGIRVCCHDFRHFWASQQVMMGTSVADISTMLGHNDLSVTTRYIQNISKERMVTENSHRSVLLNMQ